MDKERICDVLIKLKDLELGGSLDHDIPEALSLHEQGYIDCGITTLDGVPQEVFEIFIKNAGHDFLVYADALMKEGVDISRMSYADIEKYGRASLLKSLGLEE